MLLSLLISEAALSGMRRPVIEHSKLIFDHLWISDGPWDLEPCKAIEILLSEGVG
jgi:hypothetical protein